MKLFRLLVPAAVLLAACSPVASGSPESDTPSVEDAVVTEDAGGDGDAIKAPAAAARIVEITVTNFVFTPNRISVKKGDKVTLNLIGKSGIHGISIPGLGISQRIDIGATASVALPTDTAGAFDFKCNVPCGPGHKEMRGTIVIEE